MKRLLVFAAVYPYTAGLIAIIWLGGALLLKIDNTLSLGLVLIVNALVTLAVAAIGFRK